MKKAHDKNLEELLSYFREIIKSKQLLKLSYFNQWYYEGETCCHTIYIQSGDTIEWIIVKLKNISIANAMKEVVKRLEEESMEIIQEEIIGERIQIVAR